VPAKAKVAIAVLLTQPKTDLETAAKAAGLQTYMLRRYLGMPEVRAYFRAQKKILVEAIAAGNPVALKDVRDNSGNAMARVNAARAIELMETR
jgi:type IV secretory pathway protease TraF